MLLLVYSNISQAYPVERLVGTYSDAQNELSNVINRLEAAQGYEVRELILRIEKVDKNVKTGFAVGANVQAEFVTPFRCSN
jgi:hypothetical protein